MRLDIPAGTAVRFEPGDEREVDLVAFGGERGVHGLNQLTEGATGDGDRAAALERARDARLQRRGLRMATMRISRARVRELFGPTVGDRVRLGDTELWAEVEQDLLVPGDECVLRRRQDAARRPRHARAGDRARAARSTS